MDLKEFESRFEGIKKLGFVKSHRRGPTGIGKTLEDLLGIQENNIATPDIDKIELKSHRIRSNNMITLFTFNRKVWKIPQLEAIRRYGSYDRNERLGLYYTMSPNPNSAGLFLHVNKEDDAISVQHIDGTVIATWPLDVIAQRFQEKIPAMIFVSAFTEERDGIEYFHYQRARLLQGTNPDLLASQFRAGHILVDLRLHDQVTRARNHGTGFRTYERFLPELFSESKDL